MMEAAGSMSDRAGAFELSVTNVDKPALEESEILRRLGQFGDKDTVVLTRAETFQKKAALFSRRVFVQGWDTAVRLVAPRYYGGEPAMMRALAGMMAGGTGSWWRAGPPTMASGRWLTWTSRRASGRCSPPSRRRRSAGTFRRQI